MKRLFLVALLILPVFAYEYTWDRDWQDRCTDSDLSDFVIYWNSSQYRTSTGILALKVEPKVDAAQYVANFSTASFADSEVPIIPGLDYPTTSLSAGINYTFFIPFDFSTNTLWARIVANSSAGLPRCKEVSLDTKNRFKYDDYEMPLETSAVFNSTSHKFEYSISGMTEGANLFVAVLEGNKVKEVSYVQGNLKKTSKLTYKSEDVANGDYTVQFFSINNTASYYNLVNLFEFYDFELALPEAPEFVPGESYSVNLNLKNIGYWEDEYAVNFSIPEGWNVEITKPGTLSRGSETTMKLSYTVDKFQVGSADIDIIITSKSTGLSKKYTLTIHPKEYASILVQFSSINNLTAYDENNITLQIAASGTVNPKLFYTVFTEPSLLVSKGTGVLDVKSGDFTKANIVFSLGTSCAMQQEDGLGFNGGRKLLVFEKAAYDITSEISNKSLEKLDKIYDYVDSEKLKMTSQASRRLFSEAENFQSWIQRFKDAVNDGRSTAYLAGLREDIYLNIIDLESNLIEAGSRMSENCYSTDSTILHFFTFDSTTLNTKDIFIRTGVSGPKFFDFIGPSEIKAIAGESVEFTYILKNNAPEDFVIDIYPSDEMINVVDSVYLRSGARKEVKIKIRPQDFVEDTVSAYIELKSRTYAIKFPLTIEVGPFDPKITSKDLYAVTPNKVTQINLTLTTGGLDDKFHIGIDGPNWISGPSQVYTKNGKATITLTAENPDSADSTENVGVTAVSDTFSSYRDSTDFDIKVDTETPYLLKKLNMYRETLEKKKEEKTISSENYMLVKNTLNDAERYLSQGKISSAKIKLNRAESYLSKEEKTGGLNTNIIIAVLMLIASGFAFWKFLLPKIKGTTAPAVENTEDVI